MTLGMHRAALPVWARTLEPDRCDFDGCKQYKGAEMWRTTPVAHVFWEEMGADSKYLKSNQKIYLPKFGQAPMAL